MPTMRRAADRRNPYLILGLDFPATPEAATAALAGVARRLRRETDAEFSRDDATWAQHEINATTDPESSIGVYRVPANPAIFEDADPPGVLCLTPQNLPRTDGSSDVALSYLQAKAIAEHGSPELARACDDLENAARSIPAQPSAAPSTDEADDFTDVVANGRRLREIQLKPAQLTRDDLNAIARIIFSATGSIARLTAKTSDRNSPLTLIDVHPVLEFPQVRGRFDEFTLSDRGSAITVDLTSRMVRVAPGHEEAGKAIADIVAAKSGSSGGAMLGGLVLWVIAALIIGLVWLCTSSTTVSLWILAGVTIVIGYLTYGGIMKRDITFRHEG